MQSVASRLEAVAGSLPQHVSLVAVSKFHPAEAIRQAYDAGQRIFAESRVQEIVAKIPQLPADIRWHFIGHLQTNKVRALVGTRRIDLIESVDSARLLDLIDRAAADEGIVQKVLIQLHVAKEETKFGLTPDEALEFFTSGRWHTLRATHICGLMGMASQHRRPGPRGSRLRIHSRNRQAHRRRVPRPQRLRHPVHGHEPRLHGGNRSRKHSCENRNCDFRLPLNSIMRIFIIFGA